MNKITKNKTRIKQRIDALEEESLKIREELDEELDTTKDRLLDIAKVALGISGGVILSAIILRSLIGKNKDEEEVIHKHKSKRVYQRFRDQLVRELSMQATKFLLRIAQDKLKTHIEEKDNTEGNDSEITG
jgi:hypothetical protein